MTQKTRTEYDHAIHEIANSSLHTQDMKTNMMLNVIADILLDMRDLLNNPLIYDARQIDPKDLKKILHGDDIAQDGVRVQKRV